MRKDEGFGLVEFAGEKQTDRGFFCMKLVLFLNEEAIPGTELYGKLWEQRFDEAKNGQCAYKDRCPIYAKTIEKHAGK